MQLFKVLFIKCLYVKTFFSIPYNQFCQVRDTKGNSRDSKSAPCWADSQSEGWASSVVVCFPGAIWLSSVFLFVSSSSIDPSSFSKTFSADCVQIWTLYSAEMWVSVFAWIKEELRHVTLSLLCQKQNSSDKENRNTLCPSRHWVPSLWKAELSLKWQNLSLNFIFQRSTAITLCSTVTIEDCGGTPSRVQVAGVFLQLLKGLWFMIQGGLSPEGCDGSAAQEANAEWGQFPGHRGKSTGTYGDFRHVPSWNLFWFSSCCIKSWVIPARGHSRQLGGWNNIAIPR